jgi:NhaA family Na+:H+ antiporter
MHLPSFPGAREARAFVGRKCRGSSAKVRLDLRNVKTSIRAPSYDLVMPPRRDDDRALRLIRPLPDFLYTEAAGGIVLVAAIAATLVWANAWPASYHDIWTTTFTIGFPDHHLSLTLRDWVNDGLMTVFFFVVGLEIKRELVEGELRQPRKAALPVVAAVGGMIVPALIYTAFNAGTAGSRGWGIPMATDIAIAVGILSLLGTRVPSSLKLFLLALAIVDDIGAIIVIALFYSRGITWESFAGAICVVLLMLAARALGVRNIVAFTVMGIALWILVYDSGVHATLVGVALGLLTPTRPFRAHDMLEADKLTDVSTVEGAYETVVLARESVSVVEWLEYHLHPLSSYVIVPLFALANAGIVVTSGTVDRASSSSVTHGVVVGLVVGKLVGISAFVWLATKLRIGALPDGTSWSQLVGVAALGGIGFTVSLFVSTLAFPGRIALQADAKLGILVASAVAAVLGGLILLATTRNRARASGPGT